MVSTLILITYQERGSSLVYGLTFKFMLVFFCCNPTYVLLTEEKLLYKNHYIEKFLRVTKSKIQIPLTKITKIEKKLTEYY